MIENRFSAVLVFCRSRFRAVAIGDGQKEMPRRPASNCNVRARQLQHKKGDLSHVTFRSRIINSNPKSISGTPILIGIGFVFIIILLWASVAYVPPGNVGVLVYFGRVTGETLPAGTHFVSPFKINHVFSVRTQAQEEHTSTPSIWKA